MAELGLGTVQFGTSYGVSNTQGIIPSSQQIFDILEESRRQGIKFIDTAALYGSSEEELGFQDLKGFKIVTKTPSFASAKITITQVDELKITFDRSLDRLNQDSTYALLCHHSEDLLAPGGEELWKAMEEIKSQKVVQKIGVSIYDGRQLDELMTRYPLDIVQIPFNVLDQRLKDGGQLDRLSRAGVEVHSRSVFLQGLLLMNKTHAFFDPIKSNLKRWHNTVTERGLTTTQAALAFVRDQPAIDVVLVGVTELSQLSSCIKDFNGEYHFNGEGLGCNIAGFVDPSRWEIK
ncbi:MAG: aryl-alcohol dehydrogenase-like predicted oxidoreductase [Oleiphilaceae bacterium]|jgi:aryl-alcohol dehydrogenase-like predicted oxidoreductase